MEMKCNAQNDPSPWAAKTLLIIRPRISMAANSEQITVLTGWSPPIPIPSYEQLDIVKGVIH